MVAHQLGNQLSLTKKSSAWLLYVLVKPVVKTTPTTLNLCPSLLLSLDTCKKSFSSVHGIKRATGKAGLDHIDNHWGSASTLQPAAPKSQKDTTTFEVRWECQTGQRFSQTSAHLTVNLTLHGVLSSRPPSRSINEETGTSASVMRDVLSLCHPSSRALWLHSHPDEQYNSTETIRKK